VEFANLQDHIYLLSEPPGEPYYIARIMEFIYLDPSTSTTAPLPLSSLTHRPVKSLRVNWFYRPQDISHKTHVDTRMLFATMHSDICPISSVRGLCTVRHRSEIPNRDFEEYKRSENNFWFTRLHDRYIQRNYDVLPVEEVRNVPERVAEVLRSQWRYVFVEFGGKKELCMEPRRCTKCGEWCRR
jgi:BAH domain